jgi:S-adenosylmethionine:tRNA ribosyltransferase-isomerase
VKTLDFVLPEGLEAAEPPPVRDGVRLLVARAGGVRHTRFAAIREYLVPGDLIVINTSATLASALDGKRAEIPVDVHFSSELDDGDWVVEIRPAGAATGPVTDLRPGEVITLDAGGALVLGRPRPSGQARLWRARPRVEGGAYPFLARHGRPIRYAYVPRPWPLAEYQTVFAREPGSAEMPSAGRPFTERVLTDLITRGVALAPIVLHTGVSSQEPGEPPQPERFQVPEATARLVNATRQAGGRVIAVGTTVTRALESAAEPDGSVRARRGVTDLVLRPERPARVVTGLVTGWHAPGASHLALLCAVAGEPLVGLAYVEALRQEYRWHEFGDSCLLLPLGCRTTSEQSVRPYEQDHGEEPENDERVVTGRVVAVDECLGYAQEQASDVGAVHALQSAEDGRDEGENTQLQPEIGLHRLGRDDGGTGQAGQQAGPQHS